MPSVNASSTPTYEVRVDPYNAHHEAALLALPCADKIKTVLHKSIHIHRADFIAYLAFHA